MWRKARRTLLLGAILTAAAVDAQNLGAAASGSGSDVLFTLPINVDGSMKDLSLMRGESYEDAAMSFARTNGLTNQQDSDRMRQIVDQLSELLKEKMDELRAQTPEQPLPAAAPHVSTPSVQFTIPLNIDNYSSELTKFEGETVDAAVERFLYATDFNMDAMRELYPQLVQLANQKLNDLQPARRELFSFDLTIDGKPATVRHFEGGSPMEEAIATLRSIDINEGEMMDRLAPQIANEIASQLNGPPSQSTSMQDQELQQPPQRPPPRELFSIPLTLNDQAAVLVHVEGLTPRETAIRFLNDNGVTDPEIMGSYLPQLEPIIDARMSEYLREEAATVTAPAPVRAPLLKLPVDLGDNRSVDLEYYEGDSVERTVEMFLHNVGIGSGPTFKEYVVQLSEVVDQRVAALQQQQQQQELLRQQQHQQQQDELVRQQQELQRQQQLATASAQAHANRPDPLLSLSITLSNKVFDLEYFDGQEPAYVANTFCVEKHEIVRAELGVQFTGNQLVECKSVLVEKINSMLAQKRQQQAEAQAEAQTQTQGAAVAQAAAESRGEMLFSLDIDDGEGGSYQLPFYRNDNIQDTATAFCQKHNLELSNVPLLVDAMQAQLAQR